MADNEESKPSAWNNPEFRPDLAFQKLTEDMVERLLPYGREEEFPANITLFRQGDRQVDMFVVLDGEVEIFCPAGTASLRSLPITRGLIFRARLNMLTSQGSLVEARTASASRLLRIPRNELQRLMRAEGDIANLITSATIWRRIGIIGQAVGGVVLMGTPGMRR